jgi:hypothetical protein
VRVDARTRLALWLRQNWPVALFSAAVAVTVFFTVREAISYTETRTIAVEVERESGLALMAVRPPAVQVTFRGSLNELRQLDRRAPRLIVRAPRSGPGGGTERLRLRPRHLRGVAGLRVAALEPSVVEITFDHQGEREFPVAPPPLEGKPLRGRAVVAEHAPRTARVRGARLQLDQLHERGVVLQTEPVNVDGRVQGFTRQVRILPPAEAWMPEIVPAEVTVKIEIVPDTASREFAGLPVRIDMPAAAPAGPCKVDPAVVTVRLSGWAEVLRDIPADALRVYAEWPPAGDPTNPVPLRVLLPPGLAAAVEDAVVIPPAARLTPLPPEGD